jgi:hypothetical protein
MQPTQRFKKTLLASAVLFGTGITLNASAATFPVTAGAVPDVTVSFAPGFTELSFGSGIIGNKSGESCIMQGINGAGDADMLADVGFDNAATARTNFGALTGNACINTDPGSPMVIEIDAADLSTVAVTVNNITGTGWNWTPTAQSCVIDWDRVTTTDADVCQSLAGNTVTGVGMSLTKLSDGTGGTVEDSGGVYEYAAISGKTRMILAGTIQLTSEIPAGTIVSQDIVVQVTYE